MATAAKKTVKKVATKKVVRKAAPAKKAVAGKRPVAKKAVAAKKAPGKDLALAAKLKKVDTSEMTPLQKAHHARALNKALGKAPAVKKRAAGPVFKAPADFKPIFIKAVLGFGKDGILSMSKFTAIKGRADSDNAIDLSLYDTVTTNALNLRLGGPLFINREAKRFPAGTVLMVLLRVGKSAKTGGIAVGIKQVQIKVEGKKPKTLVNGNPMLRTVRKLRKFLPAAFTKLQPFPTKREIKDLTAGPTEEE